VEQAVPMLIPIMSGLSAAVFVSALPAFWPVWGWFTPLILIAIINGYLHATQFAPNSSLGSIVYLGFIVGGVFSWTIIPHTGHLH
jgi:hypothetical protein